MFLEYPNFYYKHDGTMNEGPVVSEKKLDFLFSKEEYESLWNEDANASRYRDELIKLLATFWYMIELRCNNNAKQHKELITEFLKRVRRIVEKTYANANERSNSISAFWKKSEENERLMEIYEYLYAEDDLCQIPTILDIAEEDFWELHDESQAVQLATERMEKSIEIYSSLIHSIYGKLPEERNMYKRSEVELSKREVEFIRFWTSKVPYIKRETSKKKQNNLNEKQDEINEKKESWEKKETKRRVTAIRNEMWEVLSREDRFNIYESIVQLSEDIETIKRYMRVRSKHELECKIDEIRYKLEHPYSYRIEKYLREILPVVQSDEITEEDEAYFEKNLRKIHVKIMAREGKKINMTETEFEKQIEDFLKEARED